MHQFGLLDSSGPIQVELRLTFVTVVTIVRKLNTEQKKKCMLTLKVVNKTWLVHWAQIFSHQTVD